MTTTMNQYSIITANDVNTALSELTEKIENLKTIVPGTFLWFCGDNIPDGFLVCDGTAWSKTVYPELFAVIGFKYGQDPYDDTKFCVPNLLDNDRFVRAGNFVLNEDGSVKSTTIGTKEDDAIRNIMGIVNQEVWGYGNFTAKGAFKTVTGTRRAADGTSAYNADSLAFNANIDTESTEFDDYSNPMAGHATGLDIHPYNIRLLPLIRY